MNALNYFITRLHPPPAPQQRHHRPHPFRRTHRVVQKPCRNNYSRVPFFIGDEKLPSFNTEPKNISCLKQKNTNKVAQNKKATKMPANQDDCLRLK